MGRFTKGLLRKLRRSSQLTQAELGKLVGRSGQSISNIEVGRHVPSVKTLSLILKALSVKEPFFSELSGYYKKKREDNQHQKAENLGDPVPEGQ